MPTPLDMLSPLFLGENPLWLSSGQTGYVLDTLAGTLWQCQPNQFQYHAEHSILGGLVADAEGRLIFGQNQFLMRFTPHTQAIETLCVLPLAIDEHVNDACCDAFGRLWLSTKQRDCQTGKGQLLCVTAAGCRVMLSQLSVPNGMAFSANHQSFYLVESAQQQIWVYDFSIQTGEISQGRLFIDFHDQAAYPDGLALDSIGQLWIAHWAGAAISTWSETGELQHKINLPTSKITSLCFAGEDLKTLWISSARKDLSLAELEKEPLAGQLFQLNTAYRGAERHLLQW
jgi:sugar lactone lactonase YvrE